MAAGTPVSGSIDGLSVAPQSARAIVALVGVAHFYSHFFFMLLPPLYPILTGALSLDYTQLAWLLVVFNISTGLTQAPMGVIVDRLGAVKLLIAALAVQGIVLAVIAMVPIYPLMLAAMAIAGLANAVYHPADYAILSHRIPPAAMGRAFSIHTFSGFIGGAAAPSTVIALTTLWGWQSAVGFFGAAGLLVTAILMYARESMSDQSPTEAQSTSAARSPFSMRDWIATMSSRPIMLTMVFWILISVSSNGVAYFGVAALTEAFDVEIVAANVALTSYLVGSSLGILAGGVIGDHVSNHRSVVVWGCAAAGVATFALSLASLPAFALIAILFVAGIAWGIPTPSRDLLVRAVAPPGATGAVFGFVSTGFNIGGVVGPMLFAYFMDHRMADWVFPVSGVLMILTGALVLTIPDKPAINPTAAS